MWNRIKNSMGSPTTAKSGKGNKKKSYKSDTKCAEHTVNFQVPDISMPLAEYDSDLERELEATRIVSICMGNASLLMKKQAHKKCVRLEAKCMAWKCIANAALEIK